jgi:hypothetical protein
VVLASSPTIVTPTITTSISVPLVTNAGTLSLTATGANVVSVSTNGVLRQTFNNDGTFLTFQPQYTNTSSSITLTGAVLNTRIIRVTATATLTLDTGTLLDAYYSASTDMALDFSVVNQAAAAVVTMAVATGVTNLGSAASLTVAAGISATFRLRRSAAATWQLFRLS